MLRGIIDYDRIDSTASECVVCSEYVLGVI